MQDFEVHAILMIRMFCVLAVFSLISQTESIEIFRPEDYSIKRFSEVVAAAEEELNQPPQERLIALRARLAIAERKLSELQERRSRASTAQEREDAPKIIHLRAAEARVDHYRIRIQALEKSILAAQKKPAKGSRSK